MLLDKNDEDGGGAEGENLIRGDAANLFAGTGHRSNLYTTSLTIKHMIFEIAGSDTVRQL